ncbi:MAG TPA: ABC transporter permease [bacterium]|nr:ABC transporter permease [bacterium]
MGAHSLASVGPSGVPRGVGLRAMAWRRFRRHRVALGGLAVLALVVASAIFAPALTSFSPTALDPDHSLTPPSRQHLLGTDDLGRDEFARVIYGGRISLLVGLTAMLMGSAIGVVMGSVAGYMGGWVDTAVMRFVDLMLSFPAIFLLLILINWTGGRAPVLMMITYLGLFGWTGLARIVRAEYLALRAREFVEEARAMGAGARRIIFRHILPNAMAPILVQAAFAVAGAILAEAALDFLGFGLPPDIPTWGNLLTQAEDYIASNPVLAVAPGVVITLTVVAVFFVGDALRDALDVRTR